MTDRKATAPRDSLVDILLGFAGQDKYITIPKTFLKWCNNDLYVAVFFSQALYWSGITKDPDGWFARSAKEWEEDTTLTRSPLDRAAMVLEQVGLEHHLHRSEYHNYSPVVHYRFNREKLEAAARAFFANGIVLRTQIDVRLERKSNPRRGHKTNIESIGESSTENKRDITPSGVDVSRFQNPDGSAKWSEAESVSPSPLTEKTKQSRTTKQPKTETTQTPPPSPTPSAPKLKSILAWVIDDAWAGKEGKRSDPISMASRLLPVLMGTSKKHDRVEPPATEAEILGFGRWYRLYHPNTALPMESKLASWFGQWRAAADYAFRLNSAEWEIKRVYHALPEEPHEESEVVPYDHPIYAEIDAYLNGDHS